MHHLNQELPVEMRFSVSLSPDRDSVATAAGVVREAIVLMSVHEGGANVGGINTGGKC